MARGGSGSRAMSGLPFARQAVEAAKIPSSSKGDPAGYAGDPAGYARDVLGVEWWAKQREVAQAVVEHPRVFVKASHGVGKTHMAGGLTSWHYDSFDPGITLTTAPKADQVRKLLWKEVRLQRRGRDMLPKAPLIEGRFRDGRINPGHVAYGYTARDEHSFQGQHEHKLFVVFDEATGVGEPIWVATEGMLSSGEGNRWLVILNPTDPASAARARELQGGWRVITISALDHPNIAAQLRGLPKPFPKAIDLSWIEDKLKRWCTPVGASEARPGDVAWPPLDFCAERGVEPKWYRPGPLFEGKVLGRWPSLTVDAVWSDLAWESAVNADAAELSRGRLQIGCDVARYGDDDTAIHVRKGGASLHHERGNGWPVTKTAERLKQLAVEYGKLHGVRPQAVPVAVDDCGVGGGVTDIGRADGWLFRPVNAAWEAPDPDEYPNLRSALWFGLAEEAAAGRVSFAPLPQGVRDDLRVELQAPKYAVDVRGRRVVEAKDRTKERIGRSPDNADAVMLAYANVSTTTERVAGRIEVPT